MKELKNDDILKNKVETIPQYYILDYLKRNINVDEFKIYLVNYNTLKVMDKENDYLYFKYNDKEKIVSYSEKLEKDYEMDL